MATVVTRYPANLLRLADLTPDQVVDLLDLADRMAHDGADKRVDTFRGRSLAMIFEKPSTRTRVSFEAAAQRLGMLPIALNPNELHLGRGETIEDTARVLSRYAAAIVVRTFSQDLLGRMAGAASVPVINALSDTHHPCQALADPLTIRQLVGPLSGARLAYVGDGKDNVVHSLMEAAALTGMHLTIACPSGYRPSPAVEVSTRHLATTTDASIEVVAEPGDAVRAADAVYTDVWVSMGEESMRDARMRTLIPYRVTPELMAQAKPGALFMHCLPAHRGEEVVDEVIDAPTSAVWQQAGNRLYTEQALLYRLILDS
jgi:ornithine carbamoyltransferase